MVTSRLWWLCKCGSLSDEPLAGSSRVPTSGFLIKWSGTCSFRVKSLPQSGSLDAVSFTPRLPKELITLASAVTPYPTIMAKRKKSKAAQSTSSKPRGSQAGQSRINNHFKRTREYDTRDRLSGLPNELLLKIFGLITPSHKRVDHITEPFATWGVPQRAATGDYLSLALTCRALRLAATTMLYQKYDHNFDHKTSIPFIKRLTASPECAKEVKDVKEIDYLTTLWMCERIEPRNHSLDDIEAICSKLSDLGIPEADE
jgi:hypothetical protein